jgi:GTP-binding protein EngB required for normal cell division
MILKTQDTASGLNGIEHSAQPYNQEFSDSTVQSAFNLATEVSERYQISALSGLLASARAALNQDEITVAVVGRFKAGKSSFLNDFIGRHVLPVGVVPVTACVTEIRYGPRDRATVHCLDGISQHVRLDQIGGFISEKENPENTKQVALITVDLPEIRRFAGLKFVDTPGLESALAHNTQTSLDWLPNVGLAVVTVSVDPPLSQRDIDLLKSLYRYTPKVLILLTKADLLKEHELAEVVEFVRSQLSGRLPGTPQVFPYSTRPGFERFRMDLEAALIANTLGNLAEERQSIVTRKVETLLQECGEYLTLSLKSAELVQSERQALKRQVVGEKESLDDVKSQIHLVAQSAAAGTRTMVSNHLDRHQEEISRALHEAFDSAFPKWTKSLSTMLSSFEEWLDEGLRERLAAVSKSDREVLLRPLRKVQKQMFRTLQHFRDRFSERTMQVLGVPLRTTETEIGVSEPSTPDIRIGRVFDRSWELLSPILPVWMIKGIARRHFERRIDYLVYQNLSRLSTQWEESIHHALRAVEHEAKRRIDELIGTVEHLLEVSDEGVPQIRADLARLDAVSKSTVRSWTPASRP